MNGPFHDAVSGRLSMGIKILVILLDLLFQLQFYEKVSDCIFKKTKNTL